MRFLSTVALVLIVCIVVAGFYRGWFTLSSRNSDSSSNKVDVSLTVDRDKIKEDTDAVKMKTSELTGNGTKPAVKRAEKDTPDR